MLAQTGAMKTHRSDSGLIDDRPRHGESGSSTAIAPSRQKPLGDPDATEPDTNVGHTPWTLSAELCPKQLPVAELAAAGTACLMMLSPGKFFRSATRTGYGPFARPDRIVQCHA